MEYIKEILNKCIEKIKDDYKMRTGNEYYIGDEVRITYYSIYLTSLGVRNGTYVEIYRPTYSLSEKDYIKNMTNIFKDLRKIKNIDFYIGKLYDSSKFRDTLYVYYKPRKNKLFKIIKVIENYDRKLIFEKPSTENILHSNIAKLLSYEIVDYNDDINFITIRFKLTSDGFSIMGYYIAKNQLAKAYDKMVKINKALMKINEFCELVVTNE
jgi:hypothetical protein